MRRVDDIANMINQFRKQKKSKEFMIKTITTIIDTLENITHELISRTSKFQSLFLPSKIYFTLF